MIAVSTQTAGRKRKTIPSPCKSKDDGGGGHAGENKSEEDDEEDDEEEEYESTINIAEAGLSICSSFISLSAHNINRPLPPP